MLEILSFVSSIITLFLFLVYIIGRIWSVYNAVKISYGVGKIGSDDACDDDDVDYNFAGKYGIVFSLSASVGIRSIKFYNVERVFQKHDFARGQLLAKHGFLQPNEKIYIRTEFMDVGSNLWVELERFDYIKEVFVAGDSGKDSSFVKWDMGSKMTFKSWIYYLCQ